MGKPGRKKEIGDEEILREIALHPDPVVTTSELTGRIDMSQQGLNKRLRELADDGYIVRKKVGAHAVVYWLDDAGRELAAEV
jgi:DNA-binding HxlR family transcriptional regulator